jgi:hypothetical protein
MVDYTADPVKEELEKRAFWIIYLIEKFAVRH